MDKTTHEVRLANWKALIERCQTRPKGQTAKQWLDANGISSKQYYYWLRKVRSDVYKQVSAALIPSEEAMLPAVSFAEIPAKDVLPTNESSAVIIKNQEIDYRDSDQHIRRAYDRTCKGGVPCFMKRRVYPGLLLSAATRIYAKVFPAWHRSLNATSN